MNSGGEHIPVIIPPGCFIDGSNAGSGVLYINSDFRTSLKVLTDGICG